MRQIRNGDTEAVEGTHAVLDDGLRVLSVRQFCRELGEGPETLKPVSSAMVDRTSDAAREVGSPETLQS